MADEKDIVGLLEWPSDAHGFLGRIDDIDEGDYDALRKMIFEMVGEMEHMDNQRFRAAAEILSLREQLAVARGYVSQVWLETGDNVTLGRLHKIDAALSPAARSD